MNEPYGSGDIRFDTKRAKRIMAGRGQKTTWGRQIPASMFLTGKNLDRCKGCWEPESAAPDNIKPEALYEVFASGRIREIE